MANLLFDDNAEKSLISAILLDGQRFHQVKHITSDDFMIIRHGQVWRAIHNLAARKAAIDVSTVISEVDALNLPDVDAAYITTFLGMPATSVSITTHAETIKRHATARAISALAEDMKALAQDTTKNTVDLRAAWNKAGSELGAGASRQTDIGAAINAHMDRVAYLIENESVTPGVPTGLRDYDALLSGLQKQDLVVWAARPGMGKTSAMLTAMLNQIKAGYNVGMISLEMGLQSLLDRLLSMLSGVDLPSLRNPSKLRGRNNDYRRYMDATGQLYNVRDNIRVDDMPALTPTAIEAVAHQWHAEKPLDVLYVDYLQLMGDEGNHKQRVHVVGEFSRRLKELARSLDIPVVAAAQLSRSVEQRADKRPLLSDLRDSGEIEQDSDVVTFIYRDVVYNAHTELPDLAEFITRKHRNGETGVVNTMFDGQHTRFLNASITSHSLAGAKDA